MAESTLSLTRDDVRARVSMMLGYGFGINDADSEELERVDLFLNAGLRRFLNPVTEEGAYDWTFLHPTATITMASGTQEYNLPDTCMGYLNNDLVISSEGAGTKIVLISMQQLLQKKASEGTANGRPDYAATRVKDTVPTTSAGQRTEILFYPIPDASYVLTYSYNVQVDAAASNTFLFGGQHHSETIVAACMAEAERYSKIGVDGPAETKWENAYQERLAASIAIDKGIRDREQAMSFPVTDPTYGTYQWLQRGIGKAAGYGADFNTWDHAEERHVDDVIQRGLQQFYTPPPLPGGEGQQAAGHKWSFLRPTAKLNFIASEFEYTLPSDFRAMSGEVSYVESSGKRSLTKVTEDSIRSQLSVDGTTTAAPRNYAVRARKTESTATQQREMVVYPVPNAAFEVTYRYSVEPRLLTTVANYPYGGITHADTILASCLAKLHEDDQQYQQSFGVFMQRLAASVEVDREVDKADSAASPDTTPTYGTYQWLQRGLGNRAGYGWDSATWSHEEERHIDYAIQRGLQAFYFPPPMPTKEGFSPPIKWSFLCPTATVTLVDGTTTYTLPADFSDMSGPVSFAVGDTRRSLAKVTEGEIRSKQSTNSKSGDPSVYCVRAKTTDSTAEQTKEIIVYPTPDAQSAGTVTYRYTIVPAVLTTAAEYPYGGRAHAETIMASCRAIMAEGQEAFSRAYDVFLQRLAASRSVDERVEEPEDQSWPATEPTYGTYQWLQRVLGDELGFGADYDSWSRPAERRVDDVIQRGCQQFYSPPPMPIADGAAEKPPNKWSFLCPTSTLTLVASTHTYTLPNDFGDLEGIVSFATADTRRSLTKITDAEIRSLQSTKDTTDDPFVYCIRAKATTGAAEQQHEMVVYPTPDADAAGTVTYRYTVVPKSLTPTANYPYGGRAHADTLLSSCRAILAEGSDKYGQAYQVFLQRLAASRAVDKRAEATEASTWLATEPTFGTVDWLQQEIGAAMKMGPNPGAWSNDDLQRVKSWLNRGYQEFLKPSLTGNSQHRHHRWSFLLEQKTFTTSAAYSTGTVTIAAGVVTLASGTWPTWAADGELDLSGTVYTVDTRDSGTQLTLTDLSATAAAGTTYSIVRQFYSLDSDVESIEGPMHYRSSSAGLGEVEIMSQRDLQRYRHTFSSTSSGTPRVASHSPLGGTSGTTRRIEFFPRANAVYEIHYRARLAGTTLVTTQTPLGGREHAEAILAACLAIAAPTQYRDLYAQRLGASIELDQQAQAPETLGINHDNLDRGEWDGRGRDMSVYATPYEGAYYD